MNIGEYARRYTEAQVTSVDRERLLLLVFEGGLRFLHGARDRLVAGDLVGFAQQRSRAEAVISELHGTLDHAAGGDIARDLGRLYDFMLGHLTEANVQKSVKHVDEVLAVFGTIAGAYREILERPGTAATHAA